MNNNRPETYLVPGLSNPVVLPQIFNDFSDFKHLVIRESVKDGAEDVVKETI